MEDHIASNKQDLIVRNKRETFTLNVRSIHDFFKDSGAQYEYCGILNKYGRSGWEPISEYFFEEEDYKNEGQNIVRVSVGFTKRIKDASMEKIPNKTSREEVSGERVDEDSTE